MRRKNAYFVLFCGANEENLDHLFFACSFSRRIWILLGDRCNWSMQYNPPSLRPVPICIPVSRSYPAQNMKKHQMRQCNYGLKLSIVLSNSHIPLTKIWNFLFKLEYLSSSGIKIMEIRPYLFSRCHKHQTGSNCRLNCIEKP